MLTLLIAIGLSLALTAQEKINKSIDIETLDFIPAQFMGPGYNLNAQDGDLLENYLSNYINYPEEAIECRAQGIEVVKFTVDEKGKVGNIKIVNSVCPDIDEEIIQALYSTSGMWKPAVRDGSNGMCYPTVSLCFSLQKDNEATLKYFNEHAKTHFNKATACMFVDHKIKKAERLFDQVLTYKPNDSSTLYLRGICRYDRGNVEGALEDWNRYSNITGFTTPPEELALDAKEFKGVEAFANRNK